jgi:hypothetical protein
VNKGSLRFLTPIGTNRLLRYALVRGPGPEYILTAFIVDTLKLAARARSFARGHGLYSSVRSLLTSSLFACSRFYACM